MTRFKKIFLHTIVFIILAVNSNINVFADKWPESSDIKTVSDELFSLVDLDKSEFSIISRLYKQKDYKGALDAYRDYFVDKARKLDFGQFGWHSAYIAPHFIDNADVWVGRLTADEFRTKYDNKRDLLPEYYLGISGDPSEPIEPEWITNDPKGKIPDIMWLRWFTAFNSAYWQTGDDIYIKKYFQLMNHFALNYKKQSLAGGLGQDDYRMWNYRNNFIFTTMTRTDFNIRQIVAFSKLLPNVNNKKQKWENVLAPIEESVSPDAYKLIPSDALANIIIHMLKEVSPLLLHQYIKPGAVPNQRLGGLEDLLYMSILFSEFKYIKEVIDPALKEGFESYLSGSVHPDGGNLEQAFNYNQGDLKRINHFVHMLEEIKTKPEYYEILKFRRDYMGRVFEGLKRPMGGVPSVGLGGIDQSVPLWEESHAEAWEKSNKFDIKPFKNFTSIAYPSSGYYVLRSGWNLLDTYLFTQGPRRSRGHLFPSNGSIELIYGGRHLLIAGGAPWYFESQVPEELLSDWKKYNKYFGEASTFNRNTVLVNGLSQSGTDKKGDILNDLSSISTINALWHTSERFDLTQTFWDGGYGHVDETTHKSIKTLTDVEHRRDVFYVKNKNIFILTDYLKGTKPNLEYTQVWNFAPHMRKLEGDDLDVFGFKNKEVVIDETSNSVITKTSSGPNVFLHNFINSPLEYKKYFGYKGEEGYRGWYSPGIGGKRYPKPDVHVNWKKTGKDSPLVTLVSMSNDMNDPIVEKEDISSEEKKMSGFTAKVGNDKIVVISSHGRKLLEYEDIKSEAEWMFVSKSEKGEISGVALDCTNLSVDGVSIDTNSLNFEFVIEDGNFKVTPITVPTGFSWGTRDGEIMPIYDRASPVEVDKALQGLRVLVPHIYPVKKEIRVYMEKRIDAALNIAISNIKLMSNTGTYMEATEIAEGIEELINKLVHYSRAFTTLNEKERVKGVMNMLNDEIKATSNRIEDPMIRSVILELLSKSEQKITSIGKK